MSSSSSADPPSSSSLLTPPPKICSHDSFVDYWICRIRKNNVLCALLFFLAMYALWSLRSRSVIRVKYGFINKSSGGYYYNTDTLQFVSADDRSKAIAALITLLNTDGTTYTVDQLSRLSDTFIIMILEPEDDDEAASLKTQVPILIDDDYKKALLLVEAARINSNAFKNDTDRKVVYDILVRYFTIMKTPITAQMSRWSDVLLIKTFKTRTVPLDSEYS